jgi:hypothetical protein
MHRVSFLITTAIHLACLLMFQFKLIACPIEIDDLTARFYTVLSLSLMMFSLGIGFIDAYSFHDRIHAIIGRFGILVAFGIIIGQSASLLRLAEHCRLEFRIRQIQELAKAKGVNESYQPVTYWREVRDERTGLTFSFESEKEHPDGSSRIMRSAGRCSDGSTERDCAAETGSTGEMLRGSSGRVPTAGTTNSTNSAATSNGTSGYRAQL